MATLAFQYGVNNESIVLLEYGLRDVLTDREPRDGSEWASSPSGVDDSFVTGWDYVLQATAQYVPIAADYGVRSPLTGPNSWQDFKTWGVSKQTFRLVPDASVPDFYVDGCYWDTPVRGLGQNRTPSERDVTFRIRHPTVDLLNMLRGIMFEYAPGAVQPPGLSFARASAAKFVTKALGVEEAATGVLRDRHYHSGLRTTILEPAKTSVLDGAEDFNHASWSKTNITVTVNQIASPRGPVTADKVAATASASTNFNQSKVINDTRCTYIIYAKKGSGATDAQVFGIRNNTTATDLIFGTLNYDTGAWAYTVGSTGVTVRALADGWYEIKIIVTSGITSGNTIVAYAGFTGATETAGEHVYLWGASLVPGINATYVDGTPRAAEALSSPFIYKPQALFALVDFIEYGSHLFTGTQPGYLSIGNAVDESVFLWPQTADYNFSHRRASDVISAITLTPAVGDRVQLLGLLSSNGAVQIKGNKNGGSEAVGSLSASSSLTPAWNAQAPLLIGRRFVGDDQTFAGFIRVKLGPLVFNGVTRDTVAKALAA